MSLAFDYKAIVVMPVLLAVFNAVEYAPRPKMVIAVVLATVTVLVAPLVHGVDLSFPGVLSRLVAIGLAVSAGLYLRARADYILGLRERAERLERERELLAEHAVTEERVRIARELHDVVAHNVSLMVVQAQALAATGGDQATQVETLGRIGDLGREAMSEMHRMLGVLRLEDGASAEREPQPGVRDLPALVARTRETGLAAELTVSGEPRELAPAVELSIYRIVQEALTNVIRHAKAAHAAVRLSYTPRAIEVTVLDDGFRPISGSGQATAAGEGHGLVGMRERVAMFGGELVSGARTDGSSGYQVHVVIPGG
jgi:signal transduction histidine kinase